MNHSETPWTLDKRRENLTSNGKPVCVWGLNLTWSSRTEETEANAAFIVKAVNNHYQLIEALKVAGDELAFIVNHVGLENSYDRVKLITKETREAIKEAEL